MFISEFTPSGDWANTCSQIAQHLSAKKALAAYRHVTKEDRNLASAQLDSSREPDYVPVSIPGYNAWPYDSGNSRPNCYS